MALDDWNHELNRMLGLIEKQSSESIKKIEQHFEAFGLSFDDEFRQNVMEMANLRLESSIAKIACQSDENDNHGKSTGDSDQKLTISVRFPSEKITHFIVKTNYKIQNLKRGILKHKGFPMDQQLRLIYNDVQLQDGLTFGHYNVQDGSTLRLEVRRRKSECEWQTYTESD